MKTMNPDWLLRYFNEISEAPDAVPRLRRFILDLAVRGKLVEQDLNDEPAIELLQRIGQEKGRLVKEGIRKEKQLPPVPEEDLPFQIPSIWQWSRLAEVGFVNPRNSADDGLQASFVPMPLISADYGIPVRHEVRPWGEIKSGYTHFADGDVALAKITPCFENGKSTVFRGLTGGIGAGTTELHILRPVIFNPDYALIFLKCPHFIGNGIPRMTGTAGQKRVPTEYFAFSPFPLPPLAEQHRIVAKVDELMALCDEMEAAQQKRERRRDRLVAATLNGLNNGNVSPAIGGPSTFKETARFYFNHLPRITTRPEHIQKLRQTILNLAVRGKLVLQEPSEGTGSDFLAQIKKLKTQMLLEKPIRGKQDVEYSIPSNEAGFPSAWACAHVDDVAIVQGGKRLPKGATFSKEPTDHIYIRVTDMKNGTINEEDVQYITPEVHRAIARYTISQDDLYITIAGTIGQVGRVPRFFDGHNLTENAAKIVFRGMDPDYFCMALSSGFVQQQFSDKTKQMAQPKLALKRILGAKFPLPPIAEQHRIVAKVHELMALCDDLESRLNTTATTRRQLLEATLSEAIAL